MYLVLSSQNGRDTTVPDIAPRLLTEDPQEALQAARATFRDPYHPFVAQTIIWRMDVGQIYGVRNSSDPDAVNSEAPFVVAYVAWDYPDDAEEEGRTAERFFDRELAEKAGAEVYEFETA